MTRRAADPLLAGLPNREPDFRFNGVNDPRIVQVFNDLADRAEGLVNAWLPGIPDSNERLALLSLAYNSKVERGIPTALGPNLRRAVTNGDRAEAWYEIRYGTNPPGPPDRPGIANRRYRESDLFGLYNDAGALTEADAKTAYRMFTRHSPAILGYEAQFSPANANANSTRIETQLGSA